MTARDVEVARRPWPRSAVIMTAVATVYALVVIGLCGAGIWTLRIQTIKATRTQSAAIAAFSSAYTSRMYDLGDAVVSRLASELKPESQTPEDLTARLADAARSTAQNDYFVVFDRDGDLVASSEPMRRFRAQGDTLAAHRAGVARSVGRVVRSRGNGDVIYRLSRRIDDGAGRLAGVVGVAIRPFGVRGTADRGPADPQVSVWTEGGEFIAATFVDFRDDGSAIVPPKPLGLATMLPGQVMDRDGVIRSEARVEGLPLWVSVDYDRRGVLAPWRAASIGVAGLGAFLLLLGGGFAWIGLRVIRSEELGRLELASAKARAESALRAREMLLKEIHHRVRNSLMLVSSFLTLGARGADAKTRQALEVMQARVTSIGVVHETLYAGSDLGLIDFGEYLARLLPELGASLGVEERGISLDCRVDHVVLPSDQATTLGLIVSEAVTNAVKYAFGDAGGQVVVTADVLKEGWTEVCVSDDGKGVAATAGIGMGSQLLTALAQQLGGRSSVRGGTRGTHVRVVFPTAAPQEGGET